MSPARRADVAIRPGEAGDAVACGRIIAAANRAAGHLTRLPHLTALFTRDEPLDAGDCARLVAVRDGAIVGFADFRPARAHLRLLFVDPADQGLGIGGALLDAAQSDLGRDIGLRCLIANGRSLRWYRRRGFEIVGLDLDRLEGGPTLFARLRRPLAAAGRFA